MPLWAGVSCRYAALCKTLRSTGVYSVRSGPDSTRDVLLHLLRSPLSSRAGEDIAYVLESSVARDV
jgi:hypothetical protein